MVIGGAFSVLVGLATSVAATTTLDLASLDTAAGWSAHLAAGEASFDNFKHAAINPVFTGSRDHKWPVNGFLYGGAAGGHNRNQTLYVGLYDTGYRRPFSMLAVESTSGGRSWSVSKGPLICDDKTTLFNISHGSYPRP